LRAKYEPRIEILPISQNIEAILAFYTREEQKISRSQRRLENVSGFVARPLYLGSLLIFVSLWVLANVFARQFGLVAFDPAPFFWLQGMVSLGALLTATVVLIKQNGLAKIEEQRAQLAGQGFEPPPAERRRCVQVVVHRRGEVGLGAGHVQRLAVAPGYRGRGAQLLRELRCVSERVGVVAPSIEAMRTCIDYF
jgi:GNAT superfamily N-acetyltransferase